MDAPTAPTGITYLVSGPRTITVTGRIENGHLPIVTELKLAESVILALWDNGIGVFGYRLEDFLESDNEEAAVLIVDAIISRETQRYHPEHPDAEEIWSCVDDRVRSLTGDGWRVVSCR